MSVVAALCALALASAPALAAPQYSPPSTHIASDEELAALFGQGLYAEYVAAADAAISLTPVERARRVEANFRLGRYSRVVDDDAASQAARASALAHLGACRRAERLFDLAEVELVGAAESFMATGDLALARATCALERGEPSAAITAARMAHAQARNSSERDLALYIEAAARNDRAALRALASGAGEAAARAALRLAREPEGVDKARARWSGGAFERDFLRRKAATRDVADAIDALRLLVARHPSSDAAAEAQERIGSLLGGLFREDGPAPAQAAAIFFDNVAFAPPGAEGDQLIREAVETLVRLGLYAEAADILDHQVRKRLRGGERSAVAARLAELKLAAGEPQDALDALRSTRLHGLPEALVERRHVLEARALSESGEHQAALALLVGAQSETLIDLRASIAWRARLWREAARSYAALAAARRDGAAALRGAAAAMLAGDDAQARAIAAAAQEYATPGISRLLSALTRESAQEFARDFIPAYRGAFAGNGS